MSFSKKIMRRFSSDPVYIVVLLSAAVFLLLFGFKVLDPLNTGWYSAGDMGQHYFGWKLFRSSGWMKIPGMMDTADYPFKASVVFTDSIPAAALFFKLFRGILPADFQYFGIWGLLCFILQGVFAYRIISEECGADDRYAKTAAVAATLIFTTAPVLVRRMFWHTSLASNWLILFSLYVFLMHERYYKSRRKAAAVWALIGVLCAFIHIYYLALCGMVLIGFITDDVIRNGKFFAALLPLLSYLTAAAAVLFMLGAFSSGMDTGAPGLGYYSFNLLSFINPDSFSMFMMNLSLCEDGQYEGFAYLGLGVIILLVPACGFFFSKKLYRRPKVMAAMLVVLISVISAASNEITAGQYIIVKFDLDSIIEKVWSVFRSSGRLVWDAMYLLMLAAVVVTLKFGKGASGARFSKMQLLVLVCVAIQVADLLPGLYDRHKDVADAAVFESVLKSDTWRELAASGKIRHIVLMDKNSMSQQELYSFADLAADNGMTINDYYFSRSLGINTEAVAADFARNPSADCIYIFNESQKDRLSDYKLNYTEADGYCIGTIGQP